MKSANTAARTRFPFVKQHGRTLLSFFLNTLATIQLVWFYLARVPAALQLNTFENGLERTPFQYRLLLMLPMRWAHHCSGLNRLATQMTAMPGWFPHPVHPEAIAQAAIDLLCLAAAGLVARRLYRAGSSTGVLSPFVYPLTLLMVAVTYTVQTTHPLRFVYDLPALAFVALGMDFIYFRARAVPFAMLFLVATINRETTLLLLPLYAVTQCIPTPAKPGTPIFWQRLWSPATLAVVVPLSACWIGWHLQLARHFAHNPSAAGPRLLLNFGLATCPLAWPQMLSAGAYALPLVFFYRRRIYDPTLRAWSWLLPLWLVVMLRYGLLLEPRVFGELIPFLACALALIAEECILRKTALLQPDQSRKVRA